MPSNPKIIEKKVTCLECGAQFASLAAHLKRIHFMHVNEYRDKYADPVTKEWPDIGYTKIHRPKEEVKSARKEYTDETGKSKPSPFNGVKLTIKEREYADSRYEVLFLQADEDPALENAIKDIVINEIVKSRLEEEITTLTRDLSTLTDPQTKRLNLATTMRKDLSGQILAQMDKLNLTREKKKATKTGPQSTPSRLITALERYVRDLPPEMLHRHNEEMEDSRKRLIRNIRDIKESTRIISLEETESNAGD